MNHFQAYIMRKCYYCYTDWPKC